MKKRSEFPIVPVVLGLGVGAALLYALSLNRSAAASRANAIVEAQKGSGPPSGTIARGVLFDVRGADANNPLGRGHYSALGPPDASGMIPAKNLSAPFAEERVPLANVVFLT